MSSANSLVGSTPGDNVGDAVALANGNYVVVASLWDNGATANVGAVTWANGGGGTVGAVTVANSFVGATNGDGPSTSVLALTNGNYVISNAFTDNGLIVDAGSATWRPGNAAAPGSPSITVSLLGGATNDLVGRYSVSLTNGNYVVASYEWNNGALQNAGAATWGSGTTGIAGLVSIGNSFVGTQPDESVGGNVIELVNGNFVLLTSSHDVGVLANVGSITWRPGDKAAAGSIDATNSMFGTAANDLVGFSQESLALPNGDYVVGSPYWDNGAAMNAGAVTVLPGGRASTGSVTAANSLVGGHTDDAIGNTLSLVNGAGFLVASSTWDNGALANAGAVTWVPGSAPTGLVSAENSNIGTIANGASGLRVDVNRLTANRSLVIGRPAQKVVALVTPTEYVPLAPARLADTRPGFTTVDNVAAGGGLVGAGTTLQVLVAGRGGVASGAVAAALNVTAVDAGGAGFVTVFPCGEARPTASTLNITAGSTVPNAVIAKLGTGGAICVFTTQPTHIVVDVNGFFPLVTSLRSLNPARVLDTRFGQVTIDGLQQGGGKNAAGSVLQLQVGGRAGVPADASAVALNVTVTEADVAAFVTVFPCGAPQPLASNLNVVPGVDVANLVVSRVGTNGTVCIFTSQAAHVVADVNGYFPATTGDRPLVPARLLETRAGSATIDGDSNGAGLRPAGTVTIVRVVGRAGVPVGAGSVVVNLTVTEPAGPGFVTAYPCGIDPPLASTVNFTTGATVANAAIVKIGGGGAICVVNSQPTHLVLDVSGYLPA